LPIGATANLFSALVIAFARHAERAGQDRNEAEIIRRNGLRLDLIRAVNSIARTEAVSDTTALKRLRAYAMVERLALEDAAVLYLSQTKGRRGRA
jgi:hypothetical protein